MLIKGFSRPKELECWNTLSLLAAEEHSKIEVGGEAQRQFSHRQFSQFQIQTNQPKNLDNLAKGNSANLD